jgi:hypothetical protein
MEGLAGGSVHERARRASGSQEVSDQVQHLRVQNEGAPKCSPPPPPPGRRRFRSQ